MKLERVIDQLTPANKKLAEALIHQLAQQQGMELNGDTEMPDPFDSIPMWVAWMRSTGKSPRTIETYQADAKRYLKQDPHPTTLAVEGWVAKRLETVSAARVSTTQKALKSLFKYLVEHGLWDINPVARMVLIKEAHKEVEVPPDEAILKLFNYTLARTKDNQKFKTMLFMLINTGLRMEEACSIRRALINLQKCEVTVLGKGNKERTVPISAYVAGLLDFYMAKNPTESSYLFTGDTKTGYWDGGGFRDALSLACKKLGIKHIKPHQLRHYFATRTLEHGAKLEVISKILGHADVGITVDVYRHIQSKEFHEEHEQHDPLKQLPQWPRLTSGQEEVMEGEIVKGK